MKRIVIGLLFSFFITPIWAQTYPVQQYIDTWLINDRSQTEKAAILFDDLSQHKDTVLYQNLIKQLDPLVKAKNNPRLTARLTMYKALWYLETDPKNLTFNLPSTQKAIQLVYPLNDRQLNAELYGLYGELSLRKGDIETSLLYNLKALEIQEQIGAVYFPKIAWMYSSLARSLYQTRDYEQAIHYGLKCLKQIKSYQKVSVYDRVFLYDIIGAAYHKTGKLDEAAIYYQKIIELINKQIPTQHTIDLDWGRFWLGLVDGYLGRIAFQKKQYEKARKDFDHVIKAALTYRELANAASFTNDLARLEEVEGKKSLAIAKFKQAYQWGRTAKDDQAEMDAAAGLARLYRKTGNVDSSYRYYDRYHELNNKIQTLLNRSKLNAAQARLDYDNIQYNLIQSEKKIKQERWLRNAILVAIGLIAVIALLGYNRFRLRQAYEKQLVANEMADAKEKLAEFRKRTIEKDAIIQQLTASIHKGQAQQSFDINEHIILTEEDWVSFKRAFSKAYPNFLPKLRLQLDHVTPAEERLSALLFLQLTSNQIANTLGISKDSVDRSKRRLKQRLVMDAHQSIDEYLQDLA